MFIPTIYIENSNDNMSVEVSDKKLHHLNKVLRLRDGDKINISNGKGLIYYGNLINNFVEIKNSRMYQRQNSLKIFVPYLREKNRFRFLIEKLTELNVNEIYIGITKNTQNTNYSKSKIKEWVVSALEQSGSAYLPELFFPENINFSVFTTCFDISGESFDKKTEKLNNFAIGPEGGWTDEELSKFQHKIKISEFSLRTETAAITAVSLMM
jgi:16S rRNA (uracil1498-N3)-methyltransferase